MNAPADLDTRYKHHPPNEERKRRHETVREVLHQAAVDVGNELPPSREASLFHTKMEEAMFWANACIARNVT